MKELNDRLNRLAEKLKWHNVGYAQDVLAAVEALQALEQESQKNLDGALVWQQRAEAAEAKLAELEKQEPAEYQYYYHNHGTGSGQWLPVTRKQAFESMKAKHAGDNDFSFRELFTRPAPAVSLAELVPHIGSSQVNDAAWKLHDRLGEYGPLTDGQFNNLKGCFYDALKVCMGVKS